MYTAQGEYICVKEPSSQKATTVQQSRPLLERFIVDSTPNEANSCTSQITTCKPLCEKLALPDREMLPEDVKKQLTRCEGICKTLEKN
jgi:hypothetical protein